MTLFGQPVGADDIAAIVGSLMALVICIGALRGRAEWKRSFDEWEAGRKARRDAERPSHRPEPDSDQSKDQPPRSGPWG